MRRAFVVATLGLALGGGAVRSRCATSEPDGARAGVGRASRAGAAVPAGVVAARRWNRRAPPDEPVVRRVVGRVVDADTGAGIPGAHVHLCEGYHPDGDDVCEGETFAEARSGDDGDFSTQWVGAADEVGPEYLVVIRFDYAYFVTGIDGANDDLVVRLIPEGTLRVRVVDTSGEPVEDAWVSVGRVDSEPETSTSSEDGRASFEISERLELVVSAISDDERSTAATRVVAYPGEVTDVELSLRRIELDDVTGVLVSHRGEPIAGAEITALRTADTSDAGAVFAGWDSAYTHADGSFSLALPRGEPFELRVFDIFLEPMLSVELAADRSNRPLRLECDQAVVSVCTLRSPAGRALDISALRRRSHSHDVFIPISRRGPTVAFVTRPTRDSPMELCHGAQCGRVPTARAGQPCVAHTETAPPAH